MVTHYSQDLGNSSCGRSGSTLAFTQERGQVSCKTCLRSMEKAVPAALTGGQSAPAQQPKPQAPQPQRAVPRALPKLTARASWGNRLAQMPGRNRMPRGSAQQAYI
ncbi:Conserved hypothetical protein [Pseudomonas veronii 1YdBTEX2]|uniref:Uncharacterized protein n=1 Tax=Pseudomonas veronii 1YdBTEX2 TaxID=1295141 RepID=A0A1D3K8A3_PSEVE|nr:Conserved hypothetical protein [Pseudomonas veronii 1YdBTEX2]